MKTYQQLNLFEPTIKKITYNMTTDKHDYSCKCSICQYYNQYLKEKHKIGKPEPIRVK